MGQLLSTEGINTSEYRCQYRHAEEHGGYGEFVTDPCRSIFERLTGAFSPGFGHNTSVNVHRLADRFVALTKTHLPVEFDPETLETVGVIEYKDDVEAVVTSPSVPPNS